jgi:hypothetical protein
MLIKNKTLIRETLNEHPVVFDSSDHYFIVGAGYGTNVNNHRENYHFHGFIYNLKIYQTAKTEQEMKDMSFDDCSGSCAS